MITKINEFRKLLEDHNQAEIPFDGKDPIKDKPEHVHLLNAFKRFARNTNFTGEFVSDTDASSYLTKEMKREIHDKLYSWAEEQIYDYYFNFFKENEISTGFYDKTWFDNSNTEFTDAELQKIDIHSKSLHGIFTHKGKEAFAAYCSAEADRLVNEYGFLDALKEVTKDGLEIYRSIKVKDQGTGSMYDQIVLDFNGLGRYWSYSEEGAVAHGAMNKDGTEYILYGFVRLNDINWKRTYRNQLYGMRYEMEIEVNEDAIVKLTKIVDKRSGKELPMDRPMFIRA